MKKDTHDRIWSESLGTCYAGLNSPYLWSCTQPYKKGAFVKDGVYHDPAVYREAATLSDEELWTLVEAGAF